MDLESMIETPPIVHVHVDNLSDWTPILESPPVPTVEVEPEHFDFRTIVLVAAVTQVSMGQSTSRQDIAQILAQDLTRVSAVISVLDTPCVLAGSYGQAADPANQVAGVPFPVGVLIPTGGSISLDGTDAVWIVNTTPATPCRVGVVVNRRGSA